MSEVTNEVLAGLKDFQLRTVNHVFRRMFIDADAAPRFLVADEVGLGKTLVARGLVAKTVELLRRKQDRVDIVYVCSNQDIAAQNIQRLRLDGFTSFASATRLTLLPLQVRELQRAPGQLQVNFISFTPGTTDTKGNRTGRREERRLIYHMLRGQLKGVDPRGLLNVLCGSASYEGWVKFVAGLAADAYDADIARRFVEVVKAEEGLLAEIAAAAQVARDRRRTPTDVQREATLNLISKLRHLLSKTCLGVLQPDLVILDEFQRFSELLSHPDENPSAELAYELFNHSDALRILLLSATPYKMYATSDDGEDHYAEFLRTLRFLHRHDTRAIEQVEVDIAAWRGLLVAATARAAAPALREAKVRLESRLRAVMCRTERVRSTLKSDAMVREQILVPELVPQDLRQLRALELLGQQMGQQDTIEFWKSSPYLLNFMRDYQYKLQFREHLEKHGDGLGELLAPCLGQFAPAVVDRYKSVEPANARLRVFAQELRSAGFFDLVWMPPSLAYWQPDGVYARVGSPSKQLVFSAWNVVPDALAALLSYEAERHALARRKVSVRYSALGKRVRARLVFALKDGHPGGMLNLMLLYPALRLARLVDPFRITGHHGQPLSYREARQRVVSVLEPLLDGLADRSVQSGPDDPRWYWVVLARFELSDPASRQWAQSRWHEALDPRSDAAAGEDEDSEPDRASHFDRHVQYWQQVLQSAPPGLGRVPGDLLEVLADVALCAPGTCALRSLARVWDMQSPRDCDALMTSAAQVAWGLRSQFNSPRIIALLQELEDDESYWRQVLRYCSEGNLQAVLDEYVHHLKESLAVNAAVADDSEHLAQHMYKAMSVRTASLQVDQVRENEGRVELEPFPTRMRSHFAVRFGARSDDEGSGARKEVVQAAFNSPFAPFVLTSTSVGQEGLDFHVWCHAVVHWNLPSNPVDLEQREGRVHRYKGYAVRKNVARRFGLGVRAQSEEGLRDPWTHMFRLAAGEKPTGATDLIPYWIFEAEGGASIERRVMAMPLSRDELRYRRLRRSLALYRLVFAQPRQDDLLACLEESASEQLNPIWLRDMCINLEPPPHSIVTLPPDGGVDDLPLSSAPQRRNSTQEPLQRPSGAE
ncbi:helicase-related protein [Ramlibacter tataouinensis]|uniref:helicase-related protein n=1 Tax=Ramlibacter tataouinensis TaxID=94132 RepID=UPI0022F3F6CB|nr:helicase-related protein [Ramlibacter tataouinensis]WBY02789.1 helicase-related protein [Ramlibacter tataouinensis]